jgi:hypothetical protein
MGLGKESQRHVFAGLSQPSHFTREVRLAEGGEGATSSSVGNESHSSPKISIKADPLIPAQVDRKTARRYENEKRRPRQILRGIDGGLVYMHKILESVNARTSLEKIWSLDEMEGLVKMKGVAVSDSTGGCFSLTTSRKSHDEIQ